MTAPFRFASTLRGVVFGTTLLLLTPLASAQPETEPEAPPRGLAPGLQLSLRVEPGLAVALTDPQSQRTEPGFGQTLKLLFGVTRFLEVGPTAAFTTLPTATTMSTSGTAWAFGGGARLMRPHDAPGGAAGFYAISPWIDADMLYVRTGGLDRPGFATAAGLSIPIDDRRRFWVGPYARYFQVLQGERVGFDNRDAKILQLGVSLEVGLGLEPKHARAAHEEVAIAEPLPAPIQAPPSDRDHDGISDDSDNCPDVAGLADNHGCPAYEHLVVKADKLEVKDRIAFKWDSALLDDISRPALDEVAKVLADNPNFNVKVDGHASSEGNDDHNQTLSEQRAISVVDYLVGRGIARTRLTSKGFSSSVPVATNTTEAGRETNRRVEFVVAFIIVKEGNTP